MRKWISVALLGVIGLGVATPDAVAGHWYRNPFRRHRRHHHHSSSTRDVLIGAGIGILLDRTILRPDRGRDRDRRERVYEPVPPPAARADDLRVERLRRGRIKVAWIGDDRGVESLELFVADRDKRILDAERVRERPYAATLAEPPPDGFVGVMLNYPDGSTTSVYLPADGSR